MASNINQSTVPPAAGLTASPGRHGDFAVGAASPSVAAAYGEASEGVAGGVIAARRRRRRPTMAEDVAQQLRDEIRSGELRPGDHLRQNDTADRLQVSVTPVREAFGILEREGLVQRFHQRGVVVFQPTIADVIGSFEVRCALEGWAAQRAAENISDEDIEAMQGLLSEMAVSGDDASRYIVLNAAFHHRIEAAARNPRLVALIEEQRTATNAYVLFLGSRPATFEDTEREHHVLFEALVARDGRAASEAMIAHLQARKNAIVERLRPSQ